MREQLTEFAAENARLRAEAATAPELLPTPDLAGLDDLVVLKIEYRNWRQQTSRKWHFDEDAKQMTWRDLFGSIAIKLLKPIADDALNHAIALTLTSITSNDYKVRVSEFDWETVKAQFISLGFVELNYSKTIGGGAALFWSLTELGKRVGLLLRNR